MTQYQEVVLAGKWRFAMLTFRLTDYDAGLEDNPDIEPVSHEAVLKVFNENIEHLKGLLFDIISKIPKERKSCRCSKELKSARG